MSFPHDALTQYLARTDAFRLDTTAKIVCNATRETCASAGSASPESSSQRNLPDCPAHTFVERGFDATSVNEVAAAVGVTKAGPYHHIRSKDALLFEIVTLGMDWLDEDVVKVVRSIPDTERRLRETIGRHARLTASNEPWITALLDEMHALSRSDRRKIQDRKRAYFDLVRGMIRELRAKGRIHGVDATVATYAILGGIVWIPRWFRRRRRLKAEEAAANVAGIALNALFR